MKWTARLALILCCIVMLASCSRSKRVARKTTRETQEKVSVQEQQEHSLQAKYATILGVQESQISNVALYEFVDTWMGTPYRYAGTTREGIDCSGFVGTLYRNVYQKNIPRMTGDISRACITLEKTNLSEGDIVFFDINGKKGSHVGVYLHNNRFVHSSSSRGVIISDLREDYYQKAFSHGGRF